MTRPALLPLLLAALAGAARADPGPVACPPGERLLVHGLGTPEQDLLRLAELTGAVAPEPGVIRQSGPRVRTLCAGAAPLGWLARLPRAPEGDAWVARAPVRLTTAWNSTFPSGGNDGLLWAGRGVSTLLSVGATARWGPLTASLSPEVAWSQNAWFRTVPTGATGDRAFVNPWYGTGLDLPQRPGAGPHAAASLGQSQLRLEGLGLAAGASTGNLWLGPGLRSALLLTDNAPGFPHLFLGTRAPVDVWIGRLELLALWGRLSRSRGFPEGGHPWFSALALDFEPRWVPGLHLGLGRAFVESAASLRRHAFLSILEPPLKGWTAGGDNPEDNQVASLWFRWVLPEAGLELYGEWGRDDFPISFEGLVREPERTQGWVAGLQKAFRAGVRTVRLSVEATRLHEARPLGARAGLPTWYVHPANLGWSHQGQLLGAAVGPGGDAQLLAVDVLSGSGRLGGFLERTRRNEEVYWSVIEPLGQGHDHDAELAVGVRHLLFAGPVEVSWQLSAAYRWERDFLRNQPNLMGLVQVTAPGAALGPW